jgi:hypothetical protein
MSNDDKIFLPHLYDPARRQIAIQYVQHEWRKLFPQLRGKGLWQSTDKQIADWYEMLGVRNFWNAIHGITIGFRLTSIVPWITSLNVKWTEKDISFDELYFRGKFGPIASLEVGTPEFVDSIKKAIFLPENLEFLETTKQYFESHKNDTEPRSDHPIFVVRKNGKLRVIDGNGRVLKAIAESKDSIRAFVGEPTAEPALYEHWVPTSLLVDLVFWNKYHNQAGRNTTETTAKMIVELIRDSSAGRIEFKERAVHHNDKTHMRLLNTVTRILADHGIKLESQNK